MMARVSGGTTPARAAAAGSTRSAAVQTSSPERLADGVVDRPAVPGQDGFASAGRFLVKPRGQSFQNKETLMRFTGLLLAALLTAPALVASAAQITGDYLESRSCNVFTGPCFANAEMNLAGKEALLAWKVDKGEWNKVRLDGLGAALVVNAEGTLGYDGVFPMKAGRIQSVVLVDEKASPEQRAALVAFVKDSARDLTSEIVSIKTVPFEMKTDHVDARAVFRAGQMAAIDTREIRKGDCVCSHEDMFYLPLTQIQNVTPAYSTSMSWQGDSLPARFTNRGLRSAYLGTFRK